MTFSVVRLNVARRLPGIFATVVLCSAMIGCARAADESSGQQPVISNTAPGRADQKSADDPQIADVKQLVERYFTTWSTQDMDAYGDCFLPGATVQYIDAPGNVETQPLRDFLAGQRRFQLMRPAKETPQAVDIQLEKRLARAVVYWKLEDGVQAAKFGYDHFTLLKRDGKWRIVNLTFYEVEAPRGTNP